MQNIGVRLSLILILIMVGMLYGCWFNQQPQGAGGSSVRAELLLKGTYGIRTLAEPSATWIKDQASLATLYQNLNARLGGKGVETPQIEFNNFGVLFLEMGRKPSGGYAINFDPSKTQVDNDQLTIHVNWDSPAQGMTVTQVITSPFIVLKIMHTDITLIQVLDQKNQTLFETHID